MLSIPEGDEAVEVPLYLQRAIQPGVQPDRAGIFSLQGKVQSLKGPKAHGSHKREP